MSWSLNITTKGSNLSSLLDKQSTYKCVEPEETIRQKIIEALKEAASSAPELIFILNASGSMSHQTLQHGETRATSIGYHGLQVDLKTFQIQE